MPRGGRRPGAGAPKGNLNAFRHGRSSLQLQTLISALTQLPEIQDTLMQYHRRIKEKERKSRLTAAVILTAFIDRLALPHDDPIRLALKDLDSYINTNNTSKPRFTNENPEEGSFYDR